VSEQSSGWTIGIDCGRVTLRKRSGTGDSGAQASFVQASADACLRPVVSVSWRMDKGVSRSTIGTTPHRASKVLDHWWTVFGYNSKASAQGGLGITEELGL
jgi:hypothetical protein